jgi:hypothetical protein
MPNGCLQNRAASLVFQNHGEWVLVINDDNDEAEQMWPDFDAVMGE